MAEGTVKVTAEISAQDLETLERLARQRGVSANTVLQQAIATENFMSEKITSGKKVLIENKDRSFERVIFGFATNS